MANNDILNIIIAILQLLSIVVAVGAIAYNNKNMTMRATMDKVAEVLDNKDSLENYKKI